MFRLIRWSFWLAAMCALMYFAATVPLGSRTLIEHLRAIGSTQEAQDLAKGTRDKAGEVADKVKQQLEEDPRRSGESAVPRPAPDRPGAPAQARSAREGASR